MNAFTTSTPAEPALVPGPAIQIGIDGMTCASCVRRVEKAIASAPGVARASVNLATERAEVTFAGKPDLAPILAAVSAVGYEARADTIELSIEGMTCASCVARIEKALKTVPGVTEASVNLATELATVRIVTGTADAAALEAAVAAVGYEARQIAPDLGRGPRARWTRGRDTLARPAACAGGAPDATRPYARNGLPSRAGHPSVGDDDARRVELAPAIRADYDCPIWSRPSLLQERDTGPSQRRARHERTGRAWHRCCLGLFALSRPSSRLPCRRAL
ncbi:copper ion binding protein (plasmid) [Mesorhizobium atlanticum]